MGAGRSVSFRRLHKEPRLLFIAHRPEHEQEAYRPTDRPSHGLSCTRGQTLSLSLTRPTFSGKLRVLFYARGILKVFLLFLFVVLVVLLLLVYFLTG